MTVRGPGPDATLFPPGFLRLLASVPALVRRVHVGAAAGVHAARGTGGPFLFRGHRAYRPGDDLRRVDWAVLARHDRVVVREHDAEREVRTEVWLDGSASVGPEGGRVAAARAAALACAVGLCGGGRVRFGVLRDGAATLRREGDDPADLPGLLEAIAAEAPAHRAGLASALPALCARAPSRARLFLVTDLLTDADPSVLARAAGRGLGGAVLHLRDPDTWSPPSEGLVEAVDAETGVRRVVRWTPARAERVARRAAAHALPWAHAARAAGLAFLPFAPASPPEDLLARIALEVP